jgi:hypothetical protein
MRFSSRGQSLETVTSDCPLSFSQSLSGGSPLEPQAAGAFGGADGVAVLVVEAGVEEGAPVVDPIPHRRHVSVAGEAEMGAGARPGPGFGPRDESGPHRVQLDVAQAGVKVRRPSGQSGDSHSTVTSFRMETVTSDCPRSPSIATVARDWKEARRCG